MKSLLKVLVLPSLILVLGSVGGPNVASGAYAYRTPRYAGQTYNAGDHQLRFNQATVRGINFTVNELWAEARRKPENELNFGVLCVIFHECRLAAPSG